MMMRLYRYDECEHDVSPIDHMPVPKAPAFSRSVSMHIGGQTELKYNIRIR
jgi:hypothetical protein